MSRDIKVYDVVLTEAEASEYLKLSRMTLRKGRMEGAREKTCPVPPYLRIGRSIRYLKRDLDVFLESHRVEVKVDF